MDADVLTDIDIKAEPQSERDRIESWRLWVLMRAGFEIMYAEKIAVRLDIDLHQAVELHAQGCPTAVCARILL